MNQENLKKIKQVAKAHGYDATVLMSYVMAEVVNVMLTETADEFIKVSYDLEDSLWRATYDSKKIYPVTQQRENDLVRVTAQFVDGMMTSIEKHLNVKNDETSKN